MKTKFKKIEKTAQELEVGDKMNVAGRICVVLKLEDIFHYVPNANKRVELQVVGLTGPRTRVVLFFPQMLGIDVLV